MIAKAQYSLVAAFLFFSAELVPQQRGDSFSAESPEELVPHQREDSAALNTGFTINGHITGMSSGTAYLTHEYNYKTFTDSALISNGQFVMKGRLPEPLICTLKVSGSNQIRIFFVENKPMQVQASLSSLHSAEIKGAPENEIWNGYKKNQQEIIGNKIREVRRAAKSRDHLPDSVRPALTPEDLAAIAAFKDSVMQQFVAANTRSVAAAFIIYNTYIVYTDYKMAGKLYNQLGAAARKTYYGRHILQNINAVGKTDIGLPAPVFSLPDTSGKVIALAAFKGQYVLIDFWASWCGPCRKEHPFLIQAYNRFHAKDFEIISISVDENREAWLTAIHTDGLLWKQVSDGKGPGGLVANTYGVKSIPKNFLLDKTGRIIARNLRGEELSKKLEELLERAR